MGIIWTLLYSAVDTAFPGSFSSPAAQKRPSRCRRPDRGTLGYYSFITLATVGYGDVTPTTPLARTLAWIEAVTGQFYLAILVAGLVGFKVTQAMRNQPNNEEHDERTHRRNRPPRRLPQIVSSFLTKGDCTNLLGTKFGYYAVAMLVFVLPAVAVVGYISRHSKLFWPGQNVGLGAHSNYVGRVGAHRMARRSHRLATTQP